MTPRFPIFLLLLGVAAAADMKVTAPISAAAPRSAAVPAPSPSIDAFRLINERNIFDPNRTGRREHEVRAPRPDVISFVGTMDYDRGLLAFFDGSDSSYRKALHVGEAVGPFKVTKVSANNVQIERGGKSLALSVGQQLRRPEGGDWTLVGVDVVRAEAARAAEAAAAAPGPNTPVAIPANADEVTRRMMERRNQSLKQ